MRVNSSNDSVYQLMRQTKPETVPKFEESQSAPTGRGAGGVNSDAAAVAAFQARLAQGNFNKDDTNNDGYVDQDEYIDRHMQRSESGYQPKLADVQDLWNKISQGNDHLSEAEYEAGFSKTFVVKMGHIDRPLR